MADISDVNASVIKDLYQHLEGLSWDSTATCDLRRTVPLAPRVVLLFQLEKEKGPCMHESSVASAWGYHSRFGNAVLEILLFDDLRKSPSITPVARSRLDKKVSLLLASLDPIIIDHKDALGSAGDCG
ncbi:MAG: hypothetical protein Q9219_001762 [cf. Caloplaca sp. 3 TL-2023]